jgi:hypothetical protein
LRPPLLIVTFLVLLVRLPFLHQAIQLDDIYYLTGAQHAQTDPLHPHRAHYIFEGALVDMRGHPHPPLNTWVLALLLATLHGVHLSMFHLVYIAFSWIAAISVYSLARRFTQRPMMATLMFLAMPVFWIEGNSLMADLPFLALWTAALALFLHAVDEMHAGYLFAAGAALALSGVAAYQASFLIPILWLWLWYTRRHWKPAWCVATLPLLSSAGYQAFERMTGGAFPAQVLTGYFQSYGLQSALNKLRNAAGLTVHLAWLIFPLIAIYAFARGRRLASLAGTVAAIGAALYDPNPLFWVSFGTGVLILCSVCGSLAERDPKTVWLAASTLLFFAGALVVFFAGAARYLLPAAPFVIFLAVRRMHHHPRWLAAGIALQTALAMCLSMVNYSQLGEWRSFAASIAPQVAGKRLWVNGEWGFSWYLGLLGGRQVLRDQRIAPGDLIATSELGFPVPVNTFGVKLLPVLHRDIFPLLPVTMMGVNARSGYTTDGFGLHPFEVSSAPLDRIRLERALPDAPRLAFLEMGSPEIAGQIVSGVYGVESGRWRWMGRKAVLALRVPAQPAPIAARFFIPPQAVARRVTVLLDDKEIAAQSYTQPGAYSLQSPPLRPDRAAVLISIVVDATFRTPGDSRDLGIVLMSAGFVGPGP